MRLFNVARHLLIWIFFVPMLTFGALLHSSDSSTQTFTPDSTETPPLTDIIQQILPSTATVICYDKQGNITANGSGFIYGQANHFMTNRHVLEGVHSAELQFNDGSRYPVLAVVADDALCDLILVRVAVENESVPSLQVINRMPSIGENVYVIGSPMGLQGTVTDGIVSAVRELDGLGRVIQMTAAISPGSSGSPVIDRLGHVIGVATLQNVQGQNLNFAVPSNRILGLDTGQEMSWQDWKVNAPQKGQTAAMASYQLGLSSLAEHNYSKAENCFRQAVAHDPQSVDAHVQLGFCLYQQDQLPDALDILAEAIRLDSSSASAHHYSALVYCDLGCLRRGISIWEKVIQIKPDFVEAICNLGVAYHQAGSLTKAIQTFEKAILLNPTNGDAHFNLGLVLTECDRLEDAAEAFRLASTFRPNDVESFCNMGVIFLEIEKYGEAVKAFESARQLKQNDATICYHLGMAYLKAGRPNSALLMSKFLEQMEPHLASDLVQSVEAVKPSPSNNSLLNLF